MTWPRVVVWFLVACLGLFVAYVNYVEPFLHNRGRRPLKIVVEIGQLQTAMHSYQEKYDEFPPCFAEANISDRKVRFMRHLKKAFDHSSYGDSEQAFDRLNEELQKGIRSTLQAYNFLDAGGAIRAIDLNTLDAAESLVFWLGGFPTPYNDQTKAVIANRRIFGFHRDAEAPMRRDAAGTEGLDPLRYRTEPFYQFDETRLIDIDDDGWFEYLPFPQMGGAIVAPFVYFDAKCYAGSGTKSDLLGTVRYPADAMLAKDFGFAVPYSKSFSLSTNAVTWHNPESFQIVCSGLDGLYDIEPASENQQRVVVLPAATAYRLPATKAESVSEEESDNLTNLSSNTIESWRQESGR